MLEAILSKTLTARQRAAGIELNMKNDHSLALCRGGKVLERFNNQLDLALVLAIQETANMYLENSGIQFVGVEA